MCTLYQIEINSGGEQYVCYRNTLFLKLMTFYEYDVYVHAILEIGHVHGRIDFTTA